MQNGSLGHISDAYFAILPPETPGTRQLLSDLLHENLLGLLEVGLMKLWRPLRHPQEFLIHKLINYT